ncbi:MAG: heterocyst frequency control protein PatD [Cyanobacteria bacterium J06642_2]
MRGALLVYRGEDNCQGAIPIFASPDGRGSMLPDDLQHASSQLRSRLHEVKTVLSGPAASTDLIATKLTGLKSYLESAAVSLFSRDLGPMLRPYGVEIHKELRLLQIDLARWQASRRADTQQSRLTNIARRCDRLLGYVDALQQADSAGR